MRLLAETTEDGFVFRVDLRLRPYGESGPLVCGFDFLESYFVEQGREWERYAWIKARAVAGEMSGGGHAELAVILRSFGEPKDVGFPTLHAMRRRPAAVRGRMLPPSRPRAPTPPPGGGLAH